ncbi:helix-turn-helix domain-containing protein [Helcococcus ovis]|uniref:helix-turn-helix domain-containing protein n=1 Tax=Helcococcus ovis TaxID=72026 RepID=UPI0038BCC876
MNNLFSKSTLRHIEIIKLLHMYSNTVNKNKILIELDIKDSTIKKDIVTMNQLYSDILTIKLDNNIIELQYINNCSIESFYRFIVKSSSILDIIENIFFNSYYSLEELANDSYLSVSTTYRIINKFNTISKKYYGFEVDTKNLDFKGDERNVRTFFVQLFKEKYAYSEWPFKEIERSSFHNMIIEFYNINNAKFVYSFLEIMSLICAVNFIRIKNKGFIMNNIDKNNINLNSLQNYINSNPFKEFFNKFNIVLNEDNLIELFYNYLNKDFIFSFKEMIEKSKYVNLISSSLLKILSETDRIRKKFKLNLENLDELIIRIHNGAILYNTNTNINYIAYNRNDFYVTQIKQVFPKFTKDVELFIQDLLIEIKGVAKPFEINHLTYILISTWNDLIPQLFSKKSKLKTLILSRFNSYHAGSLKSQLDLYFKLILDTHLYTENILDLKHIENSDYDLIIADFNPPEKINQPWFYIHENPTIKDYLSISETISLLINKRWLIDNDE